MRGDDVDGMTLAEIEAELQRFELTPMAQRSVRDAERMDDLYRARARIRRHPRVGHWTL